MGRTDIIVNGPSDCLLFLTASKANGLEGRPFCARTTDGGLTWRFLSFIGPEPTGYAIMPSTVRLSPTDLVTTIRRLDMPQELDRCLCLARRRPDLVVPVHAGARHRRGQPAQPAPPRRRPALPDLRLSAPGRSASRLASAATRARPGATRSCSATMAAAADVGYVRSIIRPDGKLVAVYYYNDRSNPDRYLAATILDPGKP